jgi:hypothetical protein
LYSVQRAGAFPGELKIRAFDRLIVSSPTRIRQLWRKTVTEKAKKERPTSEAAAQKGSVLIVQVVWGCYAFNATPEEAARTVVADLYELLSRGGTVTVHVEESDGRERTLEVSAG